MKNTRNQYTDRLVQVIKELNNEDDIYAFFEDLCTIKEFQDMADTYKMELDQIKSIVGDQEKDMMKKDIVIKKAVDFVIENAVEK